MYDADNATLPQVTSQTALPAMVDFTVSGQVYSDSFEADAAPNDPDVGLTGAVAGVRSPCPRVAIVCGSCNRCLACNACCQVDMQKRNVFRQRKAGSSTNGVLLC